MRRAEQMWDIFQRLCDEGNAKGNLIPDAYLAALAIESGDIPFPFLRCRSCRDVHGRPGFLSILFGRDYSQM